MAGFYDARLLELQREYARKLLTHRNPHTGLTYAEEPAVAFVEINNENGLIHAWLGEEVERLPEVLQAGLKPQWNDWLRRRYETTAALRRAWSAGEQSPGQEMITNADLGLGLEGWVLERQPGAEATAALSEEAPAALPHARSVCVTVAKPGIQSWHIRFEQPGRKVEANRAYTLSFWAKSERAGATNLSLEQTHSPWQNLGMSCQAPLTPEWKPFRFTSIALQSDSDVRQ